VLNATDRQLVRAVERVLLKADKRPSAAVARLVDGLVRLGLADRKARTAAPAPKQASTPEVGMPSRQEIAQRAAAMAREWQQQPAAAPSGIKPRRVVVSRVRAGQVVGTRVLGFKGAPGRG
jgi:hypothetical protein